MINKNFRLVTCLLLGVLTGCGADTVPVSKVASTQGPLPSIIPAPSEFAAAAGN